MSDMVERVARAICNECNDQPFDALPEAATYLERKTHVDRVMLDKQEARQVARAAIKAMRRPTETMAIVGGKSTHYPARTWAAMIGAALSETGER